MITIEIRQSCLMRFVTGVMSLWAKSEAIASWNKLPLGLVKKGKFIWQMCRSKGKNDYDY